MPQNLDSSKTPAQAWFFMPCLVSALGLAQFLIRLYLFWLSLKVMNIQEKSLTSCRLGKIQLGMDLTWLGNFIGLSGPMIPGLGWHDSPIREIF